MAMVKLQPFPVSHSDFVDPHPATLGVRLPRRLDRLIDEEAIAEGRPNRPFCRDRFEKIARLDDDLILVAGAVARTEAEGPVVGVAGTGQDLDKSAARRIALAFVKPERVLVLAVEADRALVPKIS